MRRRVPQLCIAAGAAMLVLAVVSGTASTGTSQDAATAASPLTIETTTASSSPIQSGARPTSAVRQPDRRQAVARTSTSTSTTSTTIASPSSTTTQPEPVALAPASLTLDGTSSPVVPVGVLPTGELQVPIDPRVLGWWASGAALGSDRGSVVIAGHVDSRRYGVGSMAALVAIEAGESVEVLDAVGRTHRFTIVSRQQQPKYELPPELLSVNGPPRLVLVTCGGDFDEARRRYADNIVVVAEPA